MNNQNKNYGKANLTTEDRMKGGDRTQKGNGVKTQTEHSPNDRKKGDKPSGIVR